MLLLLKPMLPIIQIFMPLIRNCQILLAELPWPFLKVILQACNAANQTIKKVNKEQLINKKWIPEASQYMKSYKKQNTVLSYWRYFAKGIKYTLIITVVSVIFGFLLGTLFALMRLSKNKFLHSIAVCYIEFLRVRQ